MRFRIQSLLLLSLLVGCAGPSTERPLVDPVMQRFEELSEEIEHIVESEGVEQGFIVFHSAVAEEPALADVCHGLAHVLGEAAYTQEGFEKAHTRDYDECGSGYVHGVVESFLAEVRDLDAALMTVCPPDSPKCFHGIGHGLMGRSRNDLPGSLTLCGRFSEKWQRIQCAEGVFMENADADAVSHPSRYLSENDPFFPCRNQSLEHMAVCAFYMPRYYLRLHPGAYQEALTWCTTIDERVQDACTKGVGAVAAKQHILHPESVEAECLTAPEPLQQTCIDGIVSYTIVHYADIEPGRALCPLLQERFRASCEQIVEQSKKAYPSSSSR